MLDTCTVAGVDLEIDLSMSRVDHLTAFACIRGRLPFHSTSHRKWGRPRMNLSFINDVDKVAQVKDFLSQSPPVPWEVDVHSHCANFLRQMWAAAEALSGPNNSKPIRDWIKDDTFTVIKTKQMLCKIHNVQGKVEDSYGY